MTHKIQIDHITMENDISDNKGLGVIRIKPLGAGGGGGESSSKSGVSAIQYTSSSVTVNKKCFDYPKMVIDPSLSQEDLFDEFMPNCIDGFIDGYNVNLIAYGQTGSGKTHTMFGPPGCMGRAAKGDYKLDIHPDYGIFPRSLIDIFHRLNEMKKIDTDNQYVITCSSVELSIIGNEDMFEKSAKKSQKFTFRSSSNGVALDKTKKPPRLYGQSEIILEKEEDLFRVFSAISVRNTSGTLMNDSSSRSHCIVLLTLWKYQRDNEQVSTSRFQFCDLAGSERLENAHADGHQWKKDDGTVNMDTMQGLSTNWSLMELSKCLEDIAMVRKNKGTFSFRAYLTDLLFLLSDSLVGNALTACFICVSQAESNKSQSKNALGFGERFSRLSIRRKKVENRLISVIEDEATKSIDTNKKHLNTTRNDTPFAIMRKAQIRDCEQILNVIEVLRNKK